MPIKINFRQYGDGPVLILLHGYGGSVLHWDGMVAHLKEKYTVVVPNLTHIYMGSTKLHFAVQIEHIYEFIRTQFPNQKVKVAGISYGAAMAWGISVNHPDLVDQLVLINPLMPNPIVNFRLVEMKYFFKVPLTLKTAQVLLATPIGKAFLKRSAKIFRDDGDIQVERLERLKGKKLHFVAYMISNFVEILRGEEWKIWEKKLSSITAPICYIYDKDDLLFTHYAYQNFETLIKPECTHELTGVGHTAIKSRPGRISVLMLDFFEKKYERKSEQIA